MSSFCNLVLRYSRSERIMKVISRVGVHSRQYWRVLWIIRQQLRVSRIYAVSTSIWNRIFRSTRSCTGHPRGKAGKDSRSETDRTGTIVLEPWVHDGWAAKTNPSDVATFGQQGEEDIAGKVLEWSLTRDTWGRVGLGFAFPRDPVSEGVVHHLKARIRNARSYPAH